MSVCGDTIRADGGYLCTVEEDKANAARETE